MLPCSFASPLGRASRFGELHKCANHVSRSFFELFFERVTGADRPLNMCHTIFLLAAILAQAMLAQGLVRIKSL